MKKIIFLTIIVSFLVAMMMPFGVVAWANMAQPNSTTTNSGVVFVENDDIEVESEVLNITLTEFTAYVEVVYNLKNTSSEAIAVDAMFLAPIQYEEDAESDYIEVFDSNITVSLGGRYIDYEVDAYNAEENESDSVYDILDNWEDIVTSSSGSGTHYFGTYGDNDEFYSYYVGTIQYTMDFEAGESQQLIVTYSAGAGGYNYKGNTRLSFAYLLTPAKYWSDFGELTINLTVPEDVSYLYKSSLDFEQVSQTEYTFVSSSLPETELYVQLINYNTSYEQYTNTLSYYTNSSSSMGTSIIIGVFVLPTLMLISAILCIIIRRKKRFLITEIVTALASIGAILLSPVFSSTYALFGSIGAYILPLLVVIISATVGIVEWAFWKYPKKSHNKKD